MSTDAGQRLMFPDASPHASPYASAPASAPGSMPAVLKSDVAYAGFWRRVLAYLIDGTFLAGVQSLIVLGVLMVAPDNLQAILNIAPVSLLVGWAYFMVMESSPARGTLGKMALNLYVGDKHGDPITFRRALARNLLKILSGLLFGIGFVVAAFSPKKQALHDVLAGTLVLRKVRYFAIGPEPPTEPGDHWDGARWVASVPPMEKS
ncbi:MAG TPA: RDD family protein [Candidatus Dormibacteraeota bacterium]|nr:RDD family protein [Candidatus Dormibacteraeota bacterium]